MKIILASSSKYRQQLLQKTGLPFETLSIPVDESSIQLQLQEQKKSPQQIAEELSSAKGKAVFAQLAASGPHLIISGDQLVNLKGTILGKPGTFDNAFAQLKKMQGHSHHLITSITLTTNNSVLTHSCLTELKMRQLTDSEITNYLHRDKPYDCAGSYKIEDSGIALFESVVSEDFTSIQGIPMIWLCNKLKEYNYEFFQT